MHSGTQPTQNFNSQRRQSTCKDHPASSESGELVLIRGLPGSGKSTMAKVLSQVGYEHFEADMFFEQDGRYQFDSTRIKEAHAWCRRHTQAALARGARVVVANTFTRLNEMEPYFSMTSNIRVIEAVGRWQNVHGVPEEKLLAMAARWEPLPVQTGRIGRGGSLR